MRRVLITGASRGIGRATALAFAERNDSVAIHYRSSAKAAKKLLDELPGNGHSLVQADLTDPVAVKTMVDKSAASLGGLDVLVNNAGRYVPHAITEVSYEAWQAEWRATLDTNLVSAANVTYCAIKHMAPGSHIVNVSSRGAFRGEPNQPAYGASKSGLNSLGQSLAVALGSRGIAVATIAPGYVETEMTKPHLDSSRGPAIRAQSPLLQRVATPQEVAAAIVWLASPEANWASGAILDFNGASYLRN
jgi:NAD(P)-dependent dehydrogenase (short-subunit alcohol dehydrogenase family)